MQHRAWWVGQTSGHQQETGLSNQSGANSRLNGHGGRKGYADDGLRHVPWHEEQAAAADLEAASHPADRGAEESGQRSRRRHSAAARCSSVRGRQLPACLLSISPLPVIDPVVGGVPLEEVLAILQPATRSKAALLCRSGAVGNCLLARQLFKPSLKIAPQSQSHSQQQVEAIGGCRGRGGGG